jgi:hypothetical protein
MDRVIVACNILPEIRNIILNNPASWDINLQSVSYDKSYYRSNQYSYNGHSPHEWYHNWWLL